MAEETGIPRGSDGERTRYGVVVYGIQVLIDSLARATGARASLIVAALGGLGLLGVVVVTGAGVVLITHRPSAEPSAPLNFPAQQASAGPALASLPATPRAGASTAFPQRSGMMVIPGTGPNQAPDPDPVQDQGIPQADPSYGDDLPGAPSFESSSKKNVAPPKAKKKINSPAFTADRMEMHPKQMSEFKAYEGGQSGATAPLPKEVSNSKIDEYAREAQNAYGKDLPGVPDIPEGRSFGPAEPNKAVNEALKVKKRSKEKIEGPVEQKEVPDVGPGRMVTEENTGGAPKGNGARITAGSDPLSTPIDVNKIQLDPSRTHNIDQTSGVQVIGK